MSSRSMNAVRVWVAALAIAVIGAPFAQAHSYQIRPGDTLNIEVLEDGELDRSVLVLPDGSISFPLIGTISASGRTVLQLQRSLSAGLAPSFANPPNVFVSVDTLAEQQPDATIDTFIMGEIANPGKLEVSPGTTILQILAEAGGLTSFAAEKRIELHRVDPVTGAIKIYLFSSTGRAKGSRIPGSTPLVPGDVITVPERRLFE